MTNQINIRLPDAETTKLDALATKLGLTRNQVLQHGLRLVRLQAAGIDRGCLNESELVLAQVQLEGYELEPSGQAAVAFVHRWAGRLIDHAHEACLALDHAGIKWPEHGRVARYPDGEMIGTAHGFTVPPMPPPPSGIAA